MDCAVEIQVHLSDAFMIKLTKCVFLNFLKGIRFVLIRAKYETYAQPLEGMIRDSKL